MSRIGYGICLESYSCIAPHKSQLRLLRGGIHQRCNRAERQRRDCARVRGSVRDERGGNVVLPSTDEQSRSTAGASGVTFSSDLVSIITLSHS